MVNPAMIFKLKGMKERFVEDHPKFPMFLKAIHRKGLTVDTVISFEITTPDGQKMSSNIKLTPNDIDTYQELVSMAMKQNND